MKKNQNNRAAMTNNKHNPQEEDAINLKKLFFKYLSYWPVFAASIFLVLAYNYISTRLDTSEPRYTVKSTLLINEAHLKSTLFLEPDGVLMTGAYEAHNTYLQRVWHNEIAMLSSRSFVQKVLEQMDVDVSYYVLYRHMWQWRKQELYKATPFRVTWDKQHPQHFGKAFIINILDAESYEIETRQKGLGFDEPMRYRFGEKVQGAGHSFSIQLAETYDEATHREKTYKFVINDRTQLLGHYISALNIEPQDRETSIVEITFRATNEQRAINFVNTLNETYIAQCRQDVQKLISTIADEQDNTETLLAPAMPGHQVVEPARLTAGASSRGSRAKLLIALMLALVLPAAFLLLRDFFNTRIREKDDVVKALDIPVVGLLPHQGDKKGLPGPVIAIDPLQHPGNLEAFRSLRSNLLSLTQAEVNKFIVITSVRPQAGKTFTALNLAGALALSGHKTLYLDANMRKTPAPLVDRADAEKGLSGYLGGPLKLHDILLKHPEMEYLFMIGSGSVPPNPPELLGHDRMQKLLDELGKMFQHIVIDTPSLGQVADAQPLLKRAGTLLYILRHNHSRQAELDFISEHSKYLKDLSAAVVINDIAPKRARQNYGYVPGI